MARKAVARRTRCPVEAYARRVVAGKEVVGRLVRLACKRHLDDLEDGHKRGLSFDRAAARRAIEFFGYLRHSSGEWAGEPFELQPWQKFVVGSLFGWKRADGLRRFRTAYVEVARKNGKSVLLAGVCLYALVADGEPGAQVYSAATTRDQAKIVFGEAERMVAASPALRERLTRTVNNLAVMETQSWFRPLSADASKMDGLNVHFAGVDEVHEHKTPEVVQKLNTATGARRQPMILEITTAGYDRQSVCRQHHEFSANVLEGVVPAETGDSWFGYIATIDDDDDWTDPKVWRKANPSLGVTVKVDDLRRQVAEATEMPAQQNAVRRLRLNQWTEQFTRWLSVEKWNECAGDVAWQDLPERMAGRRCFVGSDLSTKLDITAVVYIFPPHGDDRCVTLVPRFFIPAANMHKRVRRDRVPYDAWVRQGAIIATEGDVIDYAVIEQQVLDDAHEFEVAEIAYDPWNATQWSLVMQDHGFTMVEFRQGPRSFSEPMKRFQAAVVENKLRHGGHPVLRWMASNIAVRLDPNANLAPDKAKSAERIDGMVAALMGFGRWIVDPGPKRSVYETRGLAGVSIPL